MSKVNKNMQMKKKNPLGFLRGDRVANYLLALIAACITMCKVHQSLHSILRDNSGNFSPRWGEFEII